MDVRQLRGACLLIVDDQPANLALLAEMLRSAGYERVHTCADSRVVTETFAEVQPDLVLLDLHMPHLDGVAVMEALRPLVGDAFLPVVILTGDERREAKARALSVGAKDFLTKPFDRT